MENNMGNGKIAIGFTGDLSFSAFFKGCYKDKELLDDEIKGFLNSNDYNIINFESPVTPCKITKKKRLAHRSEPEALRFVKENINGPILSFANNHMMDYGKIGMVDSVFSANEYELPYVGAGMNLKDAARTIVLGDEVKVGVLAVQYKNYMIADGRTAGPFHESKKKLIKKRLDELKKNCDYVVMVYHGGDEFVHTPMPYVRKQLKAYLNWGCDVVVAHHPHVVQGYEYVGKKAIFYSLGNFIFDTPYQRAQEDTDKGALLKLVFDKKGFSYETLFTLIDRENKKILTRDSDEFFEDIKTIEYSKFWCLEAARKKVITENAASLKEKELSDAEIAWDKKCEEIEIIKAKAGIEEEPEETEYDYYEEEEQEKGAPKKGPLKLVWKVYKALVKDRQKNVRSIILRLGKARAGILNKQ